jgi:chaperonin GroEL
VGAATEVEMKEKQHRIEDAVHATRAAVQEGIVPGGGVALLRAGKALDGLKLEGDEAIGMDILRRAIRKPLFYISENAGQDGNVVIQKVLDSKKTNFGYNAATDTYEDLVKAGVVDPVKVVRTALQNGASVAGILLSTDAMVGEIPEKKKKQPQMPDY